VNIYSAKAKGRKHQNYVRDELLKIFPELEYDDIVSTSMGVTGEDIKLSPAARKLIPYQIECKSKAKSQVHTHYEQAKSHGDYEPLVLIKADRKPVLAVVSWEHFKILLTKVSKGE
jgi:hypothetical protein